MNKTDAYIVAFVVVCGLGIAANVSALKVEAEGSQVGRYAISAWATGDGWTAKHGYYVIDTTTGKVIDSKTE